jgi:hypothetical protein
MHQQVAFLLLILVLSTRNDAADRLVIHEWGTFTALQDENGNALGGINGDDEPLPAFVHDLIRDASNSKSLGNKGGVPVCFPSVTMRLETPVVYFHPAAGSVLPSIDVSGEFHGGLLSQFYPTAIVPAPTFTAGQLDPINSETIGKLAWNGLHIGGNQSGPATDSHVWTTPRTALSASVRASNGEVEQFLFYRGVGHIDAPIRVIRNASVLEMRGQATLSDDAALHLYYCQILPDGRCAWRRIGPMQINKNAEAALNTPAEFAAEDFSRQHLDALKTAMHGDLVAAGLFDDEATAMLNTWDLSYFKSAGTRVFFLVPRSWTDHYLPLHVSVDADIRRVMMGRIDLFTPAQRQVLQQMAGLNPQNPADFEKLIPLYQGLGQFRSALLLNEQHRHPSAILDAQCRLLF